MKKKTSRATGHRRAEDKREATEEVDTNAIAKNVNGDPDTRKAKGRAVHALEATSPGKRPSRKSTRRGANGIKPDAQQRRRAMRKTRSPEARHASAS